MTAKLYLIELDDVRTAKVSKNIDDETVIEAIEVMQDQDIAPAIGVALLVDLLNDTLDANLTKLYTGCTYTVDGVLYKHSGVKKAAIYYAKARLMRSNKITLTQYGVVNKRAEESEQVSEKDLIAQINTITEIANTYIKETLAYLEAFPLIYPTYLNNNAITTATTTLTVVGD